MWQTVGQVLLVIGAVWTIAALSARSARKDEQIKQKKQKELENERVDKAIADASALGCDECLQRLRGGGGK